jgi:hypothetical protein
MSSSGKGQSTIASDDIEKSLQYMLMVSVVM